MRCAPFLILLLPALVRADDGFLSSSGTPRLMAVHPTVRMVRERVIVNIVKWGFRVDATFEFHNDGPPCRVRMGFPDSGHIAQHDHRQGTLYDFRSWVDGHGIATTYLPDADEQESGWHVKTVAFGRGQTQQVRVAYEADGLQMLGERGTLYRADYVLSTGASWKGKIGRAEVVVRFPRNDPKGPLRLVDRRRDFDSVTSMDWPHLPRGTVAWTGPSVPTLHRREVRFVRRDFEPTGHDNVSLFFRFLPIRK